MASYGDAGPFWTRIYLTWDIVNPIMYTLIMSLFISWLLKRNFKPGSKLMKMNVLPVGVGLFDLFENVGIVTLLTVYPAKPSVVAWLSAVCTLSKVILLCISIMLMLFWMFNATKNRFKIQW